MLDFKPAPINFTQALPPWSQLGECAPAGLMLALGATHLYGARDGKLAVHCGDEYTLWALDQDATPVTRICVPQPAHTKVRRNNRDGTFWIDLRKPLTQTIALGCDWLEPVDRDEETGLFLSRLNFFMVSPETTSIFCASLPGNTGDCHAN